MLIKTENGISLHRIFRKTILVDITDVSHVDTTARPGYIEVQYTQYKVIDAVNEVIPETVVNKTYYVIDNPDILAPDGSVLLPSKLRFTNWCTHVTAYPLQPFFRAVINDTLESYPNLKDGEALPDWSQAEIDEALAALPVVPEEPVTPIDPVVPTDIQP
jgi:hypothetical protein